jgi:hypothetical protein
MEGALLSLTPSLVMLTELFSALFAAKTMLIAVGSFIAGFVVANLPFHYQEWFTRRRSRQDAAAYLGSRLKEIADELIQVDFQLANIPDRPDYFGGAPIEHVQEWATSLLAASDRLASLHNAELERLVESKLDALIKYCGRLRFYVRSLREYGPPKERTFHDGYWREPGLASECMTEHWVGISTAEIVLCQYARHPLLQFLPVPVPKHLQPSKEEMRKAKERAARLEQQSE